MSLFFCAIFCPVVAVLFPASFCADLSRGLFFCRVSKGCIRIRSQYQLVPEVSTVLEDSAPSAPVRDLPLTD